ncbi:MAG: SAM-dependent methyltransferase [Tenericutes bacterium HGW-Tenericutes-4]|nr:MAG: SAM-dependent methyltransferase [Tenericutes bacterium HGW-Tenericutes-4]
MMKQLNNEINIELEKNERLDDLQCKNLKLVQNKTQYCFSTDAVLLANFVHAKRKDVLVDLCSGSGVVAILTLSKNNLQKVYGIELQKNMYDLAQKNAKLNHLTHKLQFINEKIQNSLEFFEKNSIDVVTANPPYEKVEGHFLSDNEHMNACKYETHLTLNELIKVASDLLKFGGKFYLVHKSTRLAEIITTLKQYKLEPKVIQFVQPKKLINSNVVLIETVKKGKNGLVIKPTLIINNDDGTYTDEFKKIYKGE